MFLQYLTLKKLVWSCWGTESASGAFDEELQKLNHFHPTLQKFYHFCNSPSQLSVQQRCLQHLGNVLGSKSLSPLAGSWLLSVGNDLVEAWEMPPAAPPLAAVVFWPAVPFQLTAECWGEPGQRCHWVWRALQEDAVCAFCCRRNQQCVEKINCIIVSYSSKLGDLFSFSFPSEQT